MNVSLVQLEGHADGVDGFHDLLSGSKREGDYVMVCSLQSVAGAAFRLFAKFLQLILPPLLGILSMLERDHSHCLVSHREQRSASLLGQSILHKIDRRVR